LWPFREPVAAALPMAALGITPAPRYLTQTKAHKKASAIVRSHIGTAPRKKEQVKQSKIRKELTTRLRELMQRNETLSNEEKKKYESKLDPDQIKRAVRDSVMTPFQSLFDRLSFKEALEVYKLANEEEREEVKKLLIDAARHARKVDEEDKELFYSFFPEAPGGPD